MIRFAANTAIMLAIGAVGPAAQVACKAKSAPDAIESIEVIPVHTIYHSCGAATLGDKVIVRLRGIRIDQDGSLKLKRNIKYEGTDEENETGEVEVSPDIQNVTPTPFDILAGRTASGKLIQIKIVVFIGAGAGFIEETVTGNVYAYVRAGAGQQDYFCGLSSITTKARRKVITFFVKPGAGKPLGFAFGVKVPEVDIDGNPTGRVLPLIIDPNVKNDG